MTNIQNKDFRTLLNEELGYISGVFMSQGDTRAGDIVMPTEKLQEVADRIELYVFVEKERAVKEDRERIEEIIKMNCKYFCKQKTTAKLSVCPHFQILSLIFPPLDN